MNIQEYKNQYRRQAIAQAINPKPQQPQHFREEEQEPQQEEPPKEEPLKKLLELLPKKKQFKK